MVHKTKLIAVDDLIARIYHLAQSSPCICQGNSEDVSTTYGALARALVKGRAKIDRFFSAKLFADPAFDILLELFASEEEGRTVSITGCAHVGRVACTTGLRWVGLLEHEGLVERYSDEQDQRRTLVRLTAPARCGMIGYLDQIAAIPLIRR